MPCILENDFQMSSAHFHQSLIIEMENITFKNAQIEVSNLHIIFKNVLLINSVVTDLEQQKNTFAHLILQFVETNFQNQATENQSCGIFLANAFTAAIRVDGSDFAGASIQVYVPFMAFSSMDARFFQSHIKFKIDMFCFAQFHNVLLSSSNPSFSDEMLLDIVSLHLRAVFTSCVVQNSTGGIKLTTLEYDYLRSWIEVHVDHCVFQNNSRWGSGAGIEINFFAPLLLKQNKANFIEFKNCVFTANKVMRIGSERSHGGAVNLQGQTFNSNCHVLDVSIANSIFTDNQATDGGGAIYISQNCIIATISNTTFVVTNHRVPSQKGVLIWSFSKISIDRSVFRWEAKQDSPSLLELEMLSETDEVKDLDLIVQCSEWYGLRLNTLFVDHQAKELMISCISCPASFYFPSDGHFLVSRMLNKTSFSVIGRIINAEGLQCLPCPSGAECPGNDLTAKPNFWGSNSKHVINLHQCPADYCCAENCTSYDGCAKHRTGVLCGMCQEHYSLSMLSPHCVKMSACKGHWLWPLIIVAVTLYIIWYTLKNDVFKIPVYIARIFCKQSSRIQTDGVYFIDKGYFGIVTYFIPIKSVLALPFSADHTHYVSKLFGQIDSYVNIGLNFELSYISDDTCALTGLTTTHKTMFKFAFLFGIFTVWNIVFLFVHFFIHIVSPATKTADTLFALKIKLIYGLVEIVKYTYLGFTSIVFYSLTCLFVAENYVWFYDGSVQCYSVWQNVMIAFCLVHVIPYPLFIFLGLKLLHHKKISKQSFFIAVYFPLLGIIFWLYLMFRQCKEGEKDTVNINDNNGVEKIILHGF